MAKYFWWDGKIGGGDMTTYFGCCGKRMFGGGVVDIFVLPSLGSVSKFMSAKEIPSK